jgi:hypothetical protein
MYVQRDIRWNLQRRFHFALDARLGADGVAGGISSFNS